MARSGSWAEPRTCVPRHDGRAEGPTAGAGAVPFFPPSSSLPGPLPMVWFGVVWCGVVWCGLVWWCVCTYLALGPFLGCVRTARPTADTQGIFELPHHLGHNAARADASSISQPDDAASDEAAGQADKQKNRQTGRLRRRTTRAAQHSLAATPARDRARRGAACQWSTCKHGRQA